MRTCVHGASLSPRPLLRQAFVADGGSSNTNPSRRPSPVPDRRVRSETGRLETAIDDRVLAGVDCGRGGRTTIYGVVSLGRLLQLLSHVGAESVPIRGVFPHHQGRAVAGGAPAAAVGGNIGHAMRG